VTSNTAPAGPAVPTSAQRTGPVAPTGNDIRSAGRTSGTEGAGSGGARTPASSTSSEGAAAAAGPSIAEQMQAIDRRAEGDATARQALDEAEALRPKLTTAEQRAYLAIIKAQAFGTLGEDARSCQELRNALPAAKGTSYESQMGVMLKSCP
jgi:hypothetical protein